VIALASVEKTRGKEKRKTILRKGMSSFRLFLDPKGLRGKVRRKKKTFIRDIGRFDCGKKLKGPGVKFKTSVRRIYGHVGRWKGKNEPWKRGLGKTSLCNCKGETGRRKVSKIEEEKESRSGRLRGNVQNLEFSGVGTQGFHSRTVMLERLPSIVGLWERYRGTGWETHKKTVRHFSLYDRVGRCG